jgi:hypothetical protein
MNYEISLKLPLKLTNQTFERNEPENKTLSGEGKNS